MREWCAAVFLPTMIAGLQDSPRPGARPEVSHLARLAFKDPLKDVWAQLTARNFNNDTVSLLAFSAYNEATGLNEFRGRVRLPQSYFTAQDTKAVIDAVEFGIRHIKSEMTVRDAFEMLRKKMWACKDWGKQNE